MKIVWRSKLKQVARRSNAQQHPYHIVTASPWPFLCSMYVYITMVGGVLWLNEQWAGLGLLFLHISVPIFIYSFYSWLKDVIKEGLEGYHTKAVQKSLQLGFLLFIISELMLFFSFFWAYFHFAINPAFSIGGEWPPLGIQEIDWRGLPLLNTVLLLSSGVTITWAHRSILSHFRQQTLQALFLTILLGVIFLACQYTEYVTAPFSINDSCFGSIFFMATGFHGFHVFVGLLFLTTAFYRLYTYQMTTEHHLHFLVGAWYWHFVDIIWLFLFIVIYMWPSTKPILG